MISVIIPTYNRRLFLEGAVRSVCEQSVPCGELLIIDDGSTDGTDALVHELANKAPVPIRYVYQENRGAAAARNLGIQYASGDHICFLDSDDRFLPEKIAIQQRALKESGYLVSHTRELWFRRGKHLNQKQRHQPPDGNIFERCLPMCVVGMSTVMVHREIFHRHGLFDESLPCCEDYDFWLRVSTRERFKLVPLPLTKKNGGRGDQLSVMYRLGMDKYRIRSLVSLLENIPLSGGQYRLAARELQRKCSIYGTGCIKHGRKEDGYRYLRLPSGFPL